MYIGHMYSNLYVVNYTLTCKSGVQCLPGMAQSKPTAAGSSTVVETLQKVLSGHHAHGTRLKS